MFSSGVQQGHQGVEWPRQLIPGRMSPQDLGDRSNVSRKNRPSRLLFPWQLLGSSSLLRGRRMKERRGKWTPTISLPSPKSLLKGTWQFWAPRRRAFFQPMSWCEQLYKKQAGLPSVLLGVVKTAMSTCKHNNWEWGCSPVMIVYVRELAATTVRQMLPLPWR